MLAATDFVVFLLRLHGPFTATGEALLFAGSFGRRKAQHAKHLWVNPFKLPGREFRSLLAVSSLGVAFWLCVALALLYVHGPLPQVHEW